MLYICNIYVMHIYIYICIICISTLFVISPNETITLGKINRCLIFINVEAYGNVNEWTDGTCKNKVNLASIMLRYQIVYRYKIAYATLFNYLNFKPKQIWLIASIIKVMFEGIVMWMSHMGNFWLGRYILS